MEIWTTFEDLEYRYEPEGDQWMVRTAELKEAGFMMIFNGDTYRIDECLKIFRKEQKGEVWSCKIN